MYIGYWTLRNIIIIKSINYNLEKEYKDNNIVSYLEHSVPLFTKFHILYFKRSVKDNFTIKVCASSSYYCLTFLLFFTVNNTHHNDCTRQNNELHVNIGRRENVYRLFHNVSWHIYLEPYVLMYT